MAISHFDHDMLIRCYKIARIGHGNVSPNPCVGAILVHDGSIIGQGYHHQVGGHHAEVDCFYNVAQANQDKIPKSTMYVSLEPCSHHGRTPPCAHEIVNKQVGRVVIGLKDPNPKVGGKGISFLRKSGVQVELATLSEKAIDTTPEFLTNQLLKRPYVILKWAQSRDGFIGQENQSTKISCTLSDIMVHKWRSESDAILVGTKTAVLDNPQLTTRLLDGKNARRVVIDRNGIIPTSHHLFSDGNQTIVFGKQRSDNIPSHHRFVQIHGDDPKQEIAYMLNQLRRLDVHSLIVEGGAQILRSFINSGLWDEARIIRASFNLNDGLKAPSLIGKLIAKHELGSDLIQIIRNESQMEVIKRKLSD